MAANSNFQAFFNGWLSRQEGFLRQLEFLLSSVDGVQREKEYYELITRVFAHYQEYYREKARAAGEDVFLLMSPPWLSSFERSFLWISGFRPSMLFSIIDSSVAEELSGHQKQHIEEVKAESRRQEREITQTMARIQETVAEQPVYSLMRRFGNLVDGENPELDAAMEDLKVAMLKLVGNADSLRGWTASEVVAVMTPVQSVKFLAAVARFQIQSRMWGMERDLKIETMVANGVF